METEIPVISPEIISHEAREEDEGSVSHVSSSSISGLEGEIVTVEADLSNGLPNLSIVGLADKAVGEARERVRSAFKNSGLPFPQKKIVVNLAPADLKKNGSSYDLAIAAAILAAGSIVPRHREDILIIGELGLSGEVRRIAGIVPMLIAGAKKGKRIAFVPAGNAKEAAVVENIDIMPVRTLTEFVSYMLKERVIRPLRGKLPDTCSRSELDIADIKGQEAGKRALAIAAVGSHNVIFSGPPGTGKTMLARSFPGILPPLSDEERLELTMIYSAAGLTTEQAPIILSRPFRSPHHTASNIALIGGGTNPKPGEVTLAHRGVLFLDELPEFAGHVIDSLRQPLEDKRVTVARAAGAFVFPADFILLAAQNPCPCGYLHDPVRRCRCLPAEKQRYRRRLNGPLLDRFDIFVDIPAVKFETLEGEYKGDSSSIVRDRVVRAREFLNEKYGDTRVMKIDELLKRLDPEAKAIFFKASRTLHISARQYTKLLRVACSIAALGASSHITSAHIAESLTYRYRQTTP